MNRYAVIVAGGSGKRMGKLIPKQFLELAGKPVLMHSIERFLQFDKSIRIITVLPENQLDFWEELREKFSFPVQHAVVAGGSSRFFSVRNGLHLVEDESLVAIHDGVRPLVSIDTISRCFADAEKFGNAVPVINPSDSLRMITDQGSMPVNRQFLRIIQTPQVFYAKLIRKAYLQDYNAEFTDDATLLERTGEYIHLVEGNRENIKITNPEDLAIAEALFHTIF
jgi:2-C-methyl-D-erythritol 4-phosphate cytidylyltransferase